MACFRHAVIRPTSDTNKNYFSNLGIKLRSIAQELKDAFQIRQRECNTFQMGMSISCEADVEAAAEIATLKPARPRHDC